MQFTSIIRAIFVIGATVYSYNSRASIWSTRSSQIPVQRVTADHRWGPPGVLGIWGEGLFIFRELGSTANYFRGAGEQAYTFGDLGSTAKK